MDFFAQQDRARKHTKLLVVYFILAIAGIIASLYLVGLLVTGAIHQRQHRYDYDADSNQPPPQITLWDPNLLLGVSIGTLFVIICGTAYKTSELAGGGSVVATSLGGRLVLPGTTDPDERKLLNVVEEMSIASGVPMPQVFVLDGEQGINAFAAGHTPSDAAVAVTRGCITLLTRDELQGVIGHEFSHILNGDMRLNIRLLGLIFGILCLATIGRVLLSVRGGNRNNAAPFAIGLALLAIGAIGVFFGRLIQAAVSRQREFLADASSVQFTRNPLGLSGALQKIGGYGSGSRLRSEHAPDTAHLFFCNGVAEPFFGLLATHPPLPARIHAIDPQWDGKFAPPADSDLDALENRRWNGPKKSPPPMPGFPGMPGMPGGSGQFGNILGGAILAGQAVPPPIRTHTVMPALGNPTPLHIKYAEQLRESLSENFKAAARQPLDATALLYAILLDENEELRTKQLAEIARRVGQAVTDQTRNLAPEAAALAAHARLPVVNLALPALRQLKTSEYQTFMSTLDWLILSDGREDLFEFTLQKILSRHLASQFGQTRRDVVQFYSLKPLLPDCAVILSALAHLGSNDPAEIQKALAAGLPYLRSPAGDPELLPLQQCGLNQVDAALNRLAQAAPQIKKNLLEAAAYVTAADGVMLEHEAELLRAVADTLDCPMPPFVTADNLGGSI
jgi:Zn-dependent protease with chaperone function